MTIGVLALVGVTPDRLAALTAAGYDVCEGKQYANRLDAVSAAADSVRAVLTNGRGGLSGEEMALLPHLEIVCAVGAGYEAVDLETARCRGIAVAHCPDANATAVADAAMMLLLAATRHLLEADRFVRGGGWQDQWRVETPIIAGKRLGMLGLGRIGSRIAQRAAHGFDMEIGYHTRTVVAGAPYRYFANLLELATWADFLIAATPGGAGTRHLINADVLEALGPKGYLVNVGRGTVVDTQALLTALCAKRIAGAGLDVLEGEPGAPPLLPELLQCDDVVVTPHVAGRAPESRRAATALILANLNAHFAGQPLPSPILSKT
jgi:lactate dehydrogenase-like 2-hydroxyacid dehydrogenase